MTNANTDLSQANLLALTADIVSAQVASNKVAPSEVANLITSVHSALEELGKEAPVPKPEEQSKRPIGIRASIKEQGLVSMIDGKLYQSLKRHLTRHGLTPETYRQKFALPADYPMVSATYSERRRALAKAIGLGSKNREGATKSAAGGVRKTLKVAVDAAKEHLGNG